MKHSFLKILFSVCALVLVYLIFIMDHPYFKYTHLEDGNRVPTIGPSMEPSSNLSIKDTNNSGEMEQIIMDESETVTSKQEQFTIGKIDASLESRILGISYKENDAISLDELRYLNVLHYDFNNEVQVGELIVHSSIASDIIDIFYELYEAKYPIEKMVLVDEYDGDDNLSMKDNNTSAFNYRPIVGSTTLSKHSRGLAIDINPLYNPYVKEKNGVKTILPESGDKHLIRDDSNPYYILENDICYQAFVSRGFTWGGSWNSLKDYQHFEK